MHSSQPPGVKIKNYCFEKIHQIQNTQKTQFFPVLMLQLKICLQNE